jgi:hypothetical protein
MHAACSVGLTFLHVATSELKGDLKLAPQAQGLRCEMFVSIENALVSKATAAFGSGSDELQAKRKTIILHCLRLDPAQPDM